jgi:FkbM family methyltransferase
MFKLRKPKNISKEANSILQGEPFVCCDLGGAAGLPSHWVKLENLAHFIVYEPHEQSRNELIQYFNGKARPQLFKVLPEGISEKGGAKTLHCTNAPTGSTILKLDLVENLNRYVAQDYLFPITDVIIPTKSLAESLNAAGAETIDMIKLDIQGAELQALRGLDAKRLDQLLSVEAEAGVVRFSSEQPSWNDFDNFLSPLGFELFDIRVSRSYPKNSAYQPSIQRSVFGVIENAKGMNARAWELDLVYFKSAKVLLNKKDTIAIRKLIVAYATYNYFAEALDLAHRAMTADLIDSNSYDVILEQLKSWHRIYHGGLLQKTSGFSKLLRKVIRKLRLDRSVIWARYMWVEFPNS